MLQTCSEYLIKRTFRHSIRMAFGSIYLTPGFGSSKILKLTGNVAPTEVCVCLSTYISAAFVCSAASACCRLSIYGAGI